MSYLVLACVHKEYIGCLLVKIYLLQGDMVLQIIRRGYRAFSFAALEKECPHPLHPAWSGLILFDVPGKFAGLFLRAGKDRLIGPALPLDRIKKMPLHLFGQIVQLPLRPT